MKKFLVFITIILAVVVALSFTKDQIIKVSVEKGINLATGLKLSIESFKVGIINTLIDIKGIKLFNPEGFSDRTMLDAPQIYVNYNLLSLFSGKAHISKAALNIKEFVIVKNKDGQLNLDALNVVKEEKKAQRPTPQEKKGTQIQIDKLELKMGRVVYKDYTAEGEPLVKEYNINLDETYENITDLRALVTLIMVRAVVSSALGDFIDFNIGDFEKSISGFAATAEDLTKEVTATTKEVAEETGKALKDAAKSLKDAIKMPFGSESEEAK